MISYAWQISYNAFTRSGFSERVAELLSTLDGCVYAERVCVTDIANLNKAKKAIKTAFQKQMAGEGFTFVEVLSTCPTNWGMTPLKANQWLKENSTASMTTTSSSTRILPPFRRCRD